MKRRWWIERANYGEPVNLVCSGARWVWHRTSYRRGLDTEVVGCVCHHIWTQRVRSFVEVPDGAR